MLQANEIAVLVPLLGWQGECSHRISMPGVAVRPSVSALKMIGIGLEGISLSCVLWKLSQNIYLGCGEAERVDVGWMSVCPLTLEVQLI